MLTGRTYFNKNHLNFCLSTQHSPSSIPCSATESAERHRRRPSGYPVRPQSAVGTRFRQRSRQTDSDRSGGPLGQFYTSSGIPSKKLHGASLPQTAGLNLTRIPDILGLCGDRAVAQDSMDGDEA